MAVITLTTDFGTEDAYVAAMKGVVLGIDPNAILVDICHETAPQSIPEAAFMLATAYPYFPQGTIHVVIVDPGVGSARRAIILQNQQAAFVAPDNGVLGYVLGATSAEGPAGDVELVELPPGWVGHAITDQRYWRHPVRATFHGRDVFAPVAAYLSLGVPASAFGEALSSMYALPVPIPSSSASEIIGWVIHIDHFGNVITSLKAQDLPTGWWVILAGDHRIYGLSESYEASGGVGALAGSSGYVEIAATGGNAARKTGLKVGDKIVLKKGSAV